MTDLKATLLKLNDNLKTLRRRESKYAGSAPSDLLNQVLDHEQAIALTRQTIDGELTETAWRQALRTLAIDQTLVEGSFFQKARQVLSLPTEQQQALRNREIMLQRVHDFWIDGVLENSLHNKLLIESGVAVRPEAVEVPWEMLLRRPEQPDHRLPTGTKIVDVLDESGGSLLILGQPGAGKSTTLLNLACQTIARARSDLSKPIPVVFNLSSWAEKRLPLAEWLVKELNSKYKTPTKLAQRWVTNDEILLLLDGLDEVAPEHRPMCIQHINYFCRSHHAPMVICARYSDHELLTTQISDLQTAIVLKLLDSVQIKAYLAGLGSELITVGRMVEQDKIIQKLAQTPLMLNLMLLAYNGESVQEVQGCGTAEEGRRILLAEYVRQTFRRTDCDEGKPFSDKQVIDWLHWLAQKMLWGKQTVFDIEQIQPSWLSDYLHQAIFAFSFRLFIVFNLALLIWLLIWPFFSLHLEHALGFYRIIFGGGIAVSIWMLFYYLGDDIKPAEVLTWSWKKGLNDLRLKYVLIFGLILTPICNLSYPMVFVLFGWITWLSFFTLNGFSYTDAKLGSVSNFALRDSTRNCVGIWLLFLVLYGGLFGLFFVFLGVTVTSLTAAVTTWLIIGLIGGLKYGGLAVFQHYILRLLLYGENHVPLSYAHFLDYCVDRGFLRKVGRGYIFIHRYLLEYFASLTPEDIEWLANGKIAGARVVRSGMR